MNNLKLILVVGARPNFMKIAPLLHEIRKQNSIDGNNKINIEHLLVHTGQHYDLKMSEAFFTELEIPSPDFNLEVGSGSHAVQTAEIMTRFEKVCLQEKPDWVIVVGDVNSTMACTLVSSKLGIKVAHIEAGLRSFDRSMPEEINRLVTDALADLLLTPSEDADRNLLREGVLPEKIKCVGNIMIDTLIINLKKARDLKPYTQYGLEKNKYVFVTLHRPSNVDNKESLSLIMQNLVELSKKLPVVFPLHPRTEKNLKQYGLLPSPDQQTKLKLCKPVGYFESIGLAEKSKFVLTDSGGLQEETTFLRVPCLTLRPNTERPVTVTVGTNRLTCLENIKDDINRILEGKHPAGAIPELWDGRTSKRIMEILIAH
ncbi:UDP-N-acetyl glucosamine 2-epimerase [Desulfobacterium sp. N47]|uniref:UDP-N-acetylglucosamine 2-epimerase homolog n=1 Tax=uncultured Desulfobacterium sp. TaxID=201089 RepID=E1YJJ9_9BACT|nr:UDP-N-acetylglucosamine 2-epimerase homolog [uncultured Desulfobacterium sp.]